ncbi:MAG: caspase family protein [Treponema sp.]|jgi:WD40 repeat protein|nr:caspase family protein [Treponema sp.]
MRNIRTAIFVVVILLLASFVLLAEDVAVYPQLGHTVIVRTVALSPDEAYILSAEEDNFVHLWDAQSGKILRTFWGHNAIISALAFSPDGKTFVSGDRDGTIKLWDITADKELKNLSGHSWRITTLAYSPDGKYILSASWDATITVWDAQSGAEIHLLGVGRSNPAVSAFYSSDGKYIVSASEKNLIIWDAAAGKRLKALAEGKSFNFASYSPDGKKIASIDDDGIITIWNTETGREIRSITAGIAKGIYVEKQAVAYASVNRVVSWSSQDIKIWDADTGQKIKEIEHHGGYSILSGSEEGRHSVAISRNGRTFVGGTQQGVYVIDRESGEKLRTLSGTVDYVRAARFSPDGRQIMFELRHGNESGIWDIAGGRLQKATKGSGGTINEAYSYDGAKSVSVFLTGNMITIRKTGTGEELKEFEQEGASFNAAAFSPDGKQVVIAGDGDAATGNIRIWEPGLAGNGKIIRSFARDDTYSVTYSPDGNRIVSGHDSDIKIWNPETGREQRILRGHTNRITTVAFSRDGKYLASGSRDTTIRIWDPESGKELLGISDNTGRVFSVAFSPDGKRLVAGSYDGSVYLYDITDPERGSAKNRRIVQLVLFSGSDSAIASATRDIAVEEIAEKAASVDGEWIAITPDGYYQASPRGDRYLNVRVGNTVSGVDSYRSVFYNPEVVQARLAGRPDPASKASVNIQQAASFLPPSVTVQAASSTVTGATADISVTVSDKNQPIQNIKVLVNGTLLGSGDLGKASGRGLAPGKTSLTVTGNLKEVSFNLPVPLEPGENIIEVAAFNGYSENRRNVSVTWRTSQRLPPPNLRILAIGVNKYDDSRIRSLNYCVSDARGIVDSFKAQAGKRYAKVDSLLIADGEAITPTAANIRAQLKWLDQAGPRDVIILFLAGHGITSGNNFYFVPKDASLTTGNTLDTAKAISDRDILSVLDAPGKRLIFIDACQSGGVDGNLMTRVLMESNGLVFTAAQGSERSSEFEDLKHGIFTYSIMEGLRGKYNTRGARDIKVLPLSVSVADYVSKEVERRTRGTREPLTQNPKVYSLGFPELTIAETP